MVLDQHFIDISFGVCMLPYFVVVYFGRSPELPQIFEISALVFN